MDDGSFGRDAFTSAIPAQLVSLRKSGSITDSPPFPDGSCCDGSRAACGYACASVAPSVVDDEETCWCLLRLFSCFLGYLFFLFLTFVFAMVFMELFTLEQKQKVKFDSQFLAGFSLDSSADYFAVSSKSHTRERLFFCQTSCSTSYLLSKRLKLGRQHISGRLNE